MSALHDISIGDLTISLAGDELVLRQPSTVTHHIDEIELDVEQQLAVFLYISKMRREGRLFFEQMDSVVHAAMEAFHAHLNVCVQCEKHPFELCPIGDELLQKAGEKVLSRETVPR